MYKLEIEPSETLPTPWGTAKISNRGYYKITSRKEGNNNKLLHRLIWEKHYGEISPNNHIHHVDGNPLNNCIWNLDSMTQAEHRSLHMKGKNNPMYGRTREKHHNPMYSKTHSDESKLKMSAAHNTTGYYRVFKHKDSGCKQGFLWGYQYYDDDGKRKSISSVNLEKLYQKVKEKGLPWREI